MKKINPVYSSREFKEFREKSLKLRSILLSRTKIKEIRDYCYANGYKTNVGVKNRFPKIADEKGREMFIQQEGNKFILVDKVLMPDGSYRFFKENLSDLLYSYYMFIKEYGMDGKWVAKPTKPSIIEEDIPDFIETDIFDRIKPIQSFFRIKRFDLLPI